MSVHIANKLNQGESVFRLGGKTSAPSRKAILLVDVLPCTAHTTECLGVARHLFTCPGPYRGIVVYVLRNYWIVYIYSLVRGLHQGTSPKPQVFVYARRAFIHHKVISIYGHPHSNFAKIKEQNAVWFMQKRPHEGTFSNSLTTLEAIRWWEIPRY